MKKTLAYILFSLLVCLLVESASAQTIIRRQDFDANTNWFITGSSATNSQNLTTAGQIPSSRPGSATYGAASAANIAQIPGNSNTSDARAMSALQNGTTGTLRLTFQAIPRSAIGGNDLFISFRVSGVGIGAGNGVDAADNVTASVSLDGGANFSDETSVSGRGDAAWEYNNAVAGSAVYDGDNTVENSKDFRPTTAGSVNDPTAVSKVTLRIPNGFIPTGGSVTFRVTMTADRTDELWAVDDFIAYTNAPTAASAPISGRVVWQKRGVYGAVVEILNTENGEIRYAATTASGNFRFEDVPVGNFYVITVRHKRHRFENNSQSLQFTGQNEDLIFRAY